MQILKYLPSVVRLPRKWQTDILNYFWGIANEFELPLTNHTSSIHVPTVHCRVQWPRVRVPTNFHGLARRPLCRVPWLHAITVREVKELLCNFYHALSYFCLISWQLLGSIFVEAKSLYCCLELCVWQLCIYFRPRFIAQHITKSGFGIPYVCDGRSYVDKCVIIWDGSIRRKSFDGLLSTTVVMKRGHCG